MIEGGGNGQAVQSMILLCFGTVKAPCGGFSEEVCFVDFLGATQSYILRFSFFR